MRLCFLLRRHWHLRHLEWQSMTYQRGNRRCYLRKYSYRYSIAGSLVSSWVQLKIHCCFPIRTESDRRQYPTRMVWTSQGYDDASRQSHSVAKWAIQRWDHLRLKGRYLVHQHALDSCCHRFDWLHYLWDERKWISEKRIRRLSLEYLSMDNNWIRHHGIHQDHTTPMLSANYWESSLGLNNPAKPSVPISRLVDTDEDRRCSFEGNLYWKRVNLLEQNSDASSETVELILPLADWFCNEALHRPLTKSIRTNYQNEDLYPVEQYCRFPATDKSWMRKRRTIQ